MDGFLNKAVQWEAKGNSVATKLIMLDKEATGAIPWKALLPFISEVTRAPLPDCRDPLSLKTAHDMIHSAGFVPAKNPKDPQGEKVVRYGKFLKAFRYSLENSPLIASNPYVKNEAENVMKARKPPPKMELSLKEINNVMELNLPKYYRSTTECFLKLKPPGGVIRVNDFDRFLRSINLDLHRSKVQELFDSYDKNKNGGLDAWEFIEGFGPHINGSGDTSTTLHLSREAPKRTSETLKEVPLSAEQVKQLIMKRLPFHYKSSTKAFLACKGGVNPKSNTIELKDLKYWLVGMNIIVPDASVKELFRQIDKDGSGSLTAKEFIEVFGHAISGEKAGNIGNADHMSFTNTRPDKRTNVAPPKYRWTYEEVRKLLGERLGLIHTSTTQAFMKAKKCTSKTMSQDDLRVMLLNLNIDPEEEVVRRLYKELDRDGDGQVQCREFMEVFGVDINGHAGSFEAKPPWFYKEMAALKTHINNLDGSESGTPRSSRSKGSSSRASHGGPPPGPPPGKISKAQELKFNKKYGHLGISAKDVQTSPVAAEQPGTEAFSVHSTRAGIPRAGTPRAGTPRAGTPRAGTPRRSSSAPRPRSTPRPQSANAALRRKNAFAPSHESPSQASRSQASRSVRGATSLGMGSEASEDFELELPEDSVDSEDEIEANLRRNNMMPFYSTSQRRSGANSRPTTAGSRPMSAGSTRMAEVSSADLIAELRARQREKAAAAKTKRRPQSAGERRAPADANWYPPSAYGGYQQGAHAKSTIAAKLNRAKKMAAVYQNQERRRKKASRIQPKTNFQHDEAGDFWTSDNNTHSTPFMV